MNNEKVKRLTPTGETLRELFLKSGNLCAFPGCLQLMMDAEGTFIGQVCHIAAAEDGGERFNPNMSNEDRRLFSNLMLMCYEHHQKTNDVNKFDVNKLRSMKAEHESRFSRPDRAILEKLTDWTMMEEPTGASNLRRMNEVLELKLSEEELDDMVRELEPYVKQFRLVPIELRTFLGAIITRLTRMSASGVTSGNNILVSDIEQAFRINSKTVAEKLTQLEAYGLAYISEMDTATGPKPAIHIQNFRSGWPFWLDVMEFCEQAHEPLDAFTEDMDFGRLDAPI